MPAPTLGTSYSDRLKAASAHVNDCLEQYRAALKARNAIIVEAVDSGMSGRQVARDTGITQPHIIRLMSMSEPELGLE